MKKNDLNIVNFSAGPAMLPRPVMAEMQKEFINWYQGMSVVELSHRSPQVMAMRDELESLLRNLLNIPETFAVLFMHGGARAQFDAVPLNLLNTHKKAAYVLTGFWGESAAKAARKYAEIQETTLDLKSTSTPVQLNIHDEEVSYTHYTDNETLSGVEFFQPPRGSKGALVSDMTSSILTKLIDWKMHDCVYASCQKNLGIAGCTVVIVKKSLLGYPHPLTPEVLNYTVHEESQSLYNTPPVFAWYAAHKVLQWVQREGGLPTMVERADIRSQLMYSFLDNSKLFNNTVPEAFRSRTSIPFYLKSHEDLFLAEAEKAGLYALKGHRVVGGARACLYNAMPVEGVVKLIAFMAAFENQVL